MSVRDVITTFLVAYFENTLRSALARAHCPLQLLDIHSQSTLCANILAAVNTVSSRVWLPLSAADVKILRD